MAHFTEDQAIEIWIAKWLGVPVQKLIQKYDGCNNWRFYEVFQEDQNAGSRQKAERIFFEMYPDKIGKVDTTAHVPKRKMVPIRKKDVAQGDLFA